MLLCIGRACPQPPTTLRWHCGIRQSQRPALAQGSDVSRLIALCDGVLLICHAATPFKRFARSSSLVLTSHTLYTRYANMSLHHRCAPQVI